MTDNSIIVVKGISASGKSTRVLQFIKFLLDIKNYNVEDVFYEKRKIGFLIKEINTIYIGNFYKSGSIERLQGFDTKTSILKTSENACQYFKELLLQHNVIVEGAGTTGSYRYRPEYMCNFMEAKNIFLQFYNYLNNDRGEYHERVIYRSGKKPTKDTMWLQNTSYMKEYDRSVEEKEKIINSGFKGKLELYNNNFDAPIYDLGSKLIDFMELNFKEEFIDYSINNDYSKINTFANWEKELNVVKEEKSNVVKGLF